MPPSRPLSGRDCSGSLSLTLNDTGAKGAHRAFHPHVVSTQKRLSKEVPLLGGGSLLHPCSVIPGNKGCDIGSRMGEMRSLTTSKVEVEGRGGNQLPRPTEAGSQLTSCMKFLLFHSFIETLFVYLSETITCYYTGRRDVEENSAVCILKYQ